MLRCLIPTTLMLSTAAWAGNVSPLPVTSDYCAILRAFTQSPDPACMPTPQLGPARSLDAAGAAPPATDGDAGYYIHFSFDSKDLSEEYQQHLRRLSGVFKSDAMAGLCMKLVGHADTTGPAGYNRRLSVGRAKAVQLYLVGVGALAADRIVHSGMGESDALPGIPGEDPRNRRVEILAKERIGEDCS